MTTRHALRGARGAVWWSIVAMTAFAPAVPAAGPPGPNPVNDFRPPAGATPTASPPAFLPDDSSSPTRLVCRRLAATFTPTPTPPQSIAILASASSTPYSTATPTLTFTVTATFTPAPTLAAGCRWTTFRLSSDDDASWTRIDASGPAPAWPPAGGSGPSDVTGDRHVTVMVQGSSDTLAAVSFSETPPTVAWPSLVDLEANGAWTVENLASNNQSTIDYRSIQFPSAPGYMIPWVETWSHPPCGTAGLQSDLDACDPDIVVMVPEANDAMWPNLYPDQLYRGPQDLVDSLMSQCNAVLASNPKRTCLVPTMSKAPYVAAWPAASAWIDQANALIRQVFPNTRVVDFSTASSNALDYYHSPWGYEGLVAHSNQRVHDVRAGRVVAALMHSVFTTKARVLQAETRLWNGVSGLSVSGLRWDTSSLPDDVDVRNAVLEVRSTYRGASDAGAETRSVGFQWANSQAADGWQAGDWPASLSATAYVGAPAIGATEERGMPWSFALTPPSAVSLTGYTGLYGFVTPSTLPPADTYFNYDLVSADAAFGPEKVCVGGLGTNTGTPCPVGDECTGGAVCLAGGACFGGSNPGTACSLGTECSGGGICLASDGAPKLHVHYCVPTPTVTLNVPTNTAAVTDTVAAVTQTPTRTVQQVMATATATSQAPPTPTPTTAAAPCVGDCDGSNDVFINELIIGVSIAQRPLSLDRCPAFDPSGSNAVEIDELITAVTNALSGCSQRRDQSA